VTTETFCELEAIAEVSNSPVKAWRERSEIHGAALRSERLGRSVYHPNNEHVFTVNDGPPHPPFWMILGSWARHERILIANEPSSIVSRDMVDEKPEKKPEGKGGTGKEKDESAGAEVAGRGKRLILTCWQCGATNYVDSDWDWTYFHCWRCGYVVEIR